MDKETRKVIAAGERVKTAMAELVEAFMDQHAQELREWGHPVEEEYWIDVCRDSVLSAIADHSLDLPDSAWLALSVAWDAVNCIARAPVTAETLALNKRLREIFGR
jgi:hypothetical protein